MMKRPTLGGPTSQVFSESKPPSWRFEPKQGFTFASYPRRPTLGGPTLQDNSEGQPPGGGASAWGYPFFRTIFCPKMLLFRTLFLLLSSMYSNVECAPMCLGRPILTTFFGQIFEQKCPKNIYLSPSVGGAAKKPVNHSDKFNHIPAG
jgi:hypothetical protein